MREKMNLCITALVCAFILFFCVMNAKQLVVSVIPDILHQRDNIEAGIDSAEADYQNNFYRKNLFCDICGVYQKVLSRQVVGNFEYIIDDNEVMHNVIEYGYDLEPVMSAILTVSEMVEECGSDFLYIQGPNREFDHSQNDIAASFNIDDATMDVMVDRLQGQGIDVLDVRQSFLEEDTGIESKDVFFRTDLHMQTEAELWVARLIGNYVNDEYDTTFQNLEYLSEPDKYFTVKNQKFLGSFGRNIGRYNVPLDDFERYEPNIPTDYEMNIYLTGVTKTGSFRDVITNGYDLQDVDEYTYWVTDYLSYGQPYYTITNNNQTSGSVLFITDSIGYRTISFLSLCCREITILDPRFFAGVNYIEQALQDRQYDMVIVYQATFLTGVPWNLEQ